MNGIAGIRARWVSIGLIGALWLSATLALQIVNPTFLPRIAPVFIFGGFLSALASLHLRARSAVLVHVLGLALAFVVALGAVLITSGALTADHVSPAMTRDAMRSLFMSPTLMVASARADTRIFFLGVSAVAWIAAYASVWAEVHWRTAWVGVIFAGGPLLVALAASPPEAHILVLPFVAVALLLLAHNHALGRQAAWQEGLRQLPSAGNQRLMTAGSVLAAVAVGVGWLAPTIPAYPVVSYDEFQGIVQSTLQGTQATINKTVYDLANQFQPVALADALPMTSSVSTSDAPVFEVQFNGPSIGRKWRTNVYDQYSNGNWVNSNRNSTVAAAGETVVPRIPWEARSVISQTVTMLRPAGGIVPSVGEPVAVTVPVRVEYGATTTQSGRDGVSADISRVSLDRAWEDGPTFTVFSAPSTAGPFQLHSASANYPAWVRDKYLQLPDTVPPRVALLAQQIVSGRSTPYDQALALEAYLRTLPYTLDIATPPAGRDLVDWFLFDEKQGYCTYYASAFVVMARSLGIPARLVTGYKFGEYDPARGVMRTRMSDVHAWPEVFFPNYGWIEFEPTGSEPPSPGDEGAPVGPAPLLSAVLPPGTAQYVADQQPQASLDEGTKRDFRGFSLVSALAAVGLLTTAGVRHTRRAKRVPVSEVWEKLLVFGSQLGVRSESGATPYEIGTTIGRAAPKARPDIERLTTLYVRHRFDPRGLSDHEYDALTAAWPRLRNTLWRARVTQLAERAATTVNSTRRQLNEVASGRAPCEKGVAYRISSILFQREN